MTIAEKKSFREAFFAEAGENLRLIAQTMNYLPDIAMYIKAADGRIVALNKRNCEFCNIRREIDAVGRRSCDLFPEVLSSVYMSDDRRVLERGQPFFDKVQQYCASRSMQFQHKNVIPLRNARGAIIGTMCFYWLSDSPSGAPAWHGSFSRITEYIQQHQNEKITLAELARSVGMSVSTFSRNFEKALGSSPGEYITQIRITSACRLLEETDKTLTDIAQETGFYDLSHFTKAFKSLRGMTPGRYRRNHLKADGTHNRGLSPFDD